mmetsp:Transcript_101208/g.325156  ORF Transcript_101208/g.325156 Transcript_101208/m.325156 type:complete len:211 (-) Transcript_101208:1687-2319(-)
MPPPCGHRALGRLPQPCSRWRESAGARYRSSDVLWVTSSGARRMRPQQPRLMEVRQLHTARSRTRLHLKTCRRLHQTCPSWTTGALQQSQARSWQCPSRRLPPMLLSPLCPWPLPRQMSSAPRAEVPEACPSSVSPGGCCLRHRRNRSLATATALRPPKPSPRASRRTSPSPRPPPPMRPPLRGPPPQRPRPHRRLPPCRRRRRRLRCPS